MRAIIESLTGEFLRYKALAEGAIAQLEEPQLSAAGPNGGNSIATICWHISGNLRSRFTEFLTSDGEKPWRHREEEFKGRTATRAELLATWEQGWGTLLGTLEQLADEQLEARVTIRGQPLRAHEALHRSLAHLAYHVGQVVYISKALRGGEWRYLSIPPGQSDAYDQAPTLERYGSVDVREGSHDGPHGDSRKS